MGLGPFSRLSRSSRLLNGPSRSGFRPGHVPWWPRPDVKLSNSLVDVLTETNQHAGHADILHEQLVKSTGTTARHATPHRDATFREALCAKIERAAEAAATRPDHAGPPTTFT
ncbi:DUF664 domain-containing protein [Streptomyces sp. SID5594]|nr:DUF664 domain-containing protein [Streptomyces sp. SID5594]